METQVRQRHLLAFLDRYGVDSPALQYATSLLLDAPKHIPAVSDSSSIESVALFGLDDDEWEDAVRAARLQRKLDQLSSQFPLTLLSDSVVDADSGRIQLWGRQVIRPSVLEDQLGMSIATSDWQIVMDALQLLPSSWSVVLEISRGTA